MKAGFEMVHGTTLDTIQPHESWNSYPTVGFQNPISIPFPKPPVTENRCVNLDRNELSEWVEHITKQLIDDLPESTAAAAASPADAAFHTATTSSDDNNFHQSIPGGELRPKKMLRSYLETDGDDESVQWNNNNEIFQNGRDGTGLGLSKVDEHGLSLITLLLECAVAISVDNLGEARRMLLELSQLASPYAESCGERVVAYFAKAMSSRVINSWLGISSPFLNHRTVHSTFQLFNNISPFIKFAHFTSNQAILEAFHRRDRVHIVDLDIMQGLQWPALFHILATRIEGPPHVRLTGLGTSMEILMETGKQLSNFAKRLGISFEFQPIASKFGDIDVSAFQLRRGETLAVHWLQHSLYDATGPDWKTIRLLEELAPRIVTVVEQDVSKGGSFLDRFVGALHYYSTVFDSLGAYLGSEDPSRHRVEHCLVYKEINNILAIGGPARSGEDKFRHWRSEIGKRFLQVPMSANSMAQAQLILNMFPPAHGYSLVQGDGVLRLGWKETSLYTASAWTSCTSNIVPRYSC
ncbi:protein SCARECROW [Ziziphus jujuba]|uniref:Protein SCARECROW n=1 Tax=Ziziphus jujuba TaxID=326968 RepID=A0A6P4A9G1_ZIZJJ|nr:protein SCARECROW [Ziziphus jujuba]